MQHFGCPAVTVKEWIKQILIFHVKKLENKLTQWDIQRSGNFLSRILGLQLFVTRGAMLGCKHPAPKQEATGAGRTFDNTHVVAYIRMYRSCPVAAQPQNSCTF